MTAPRLISIYDGRICIGFMLARGRAGFEAVAADQTPIGTFPDIKAAADAVSANAIRPASGNES